MSPVRIIVVPDKFKGTLSAREAGASIAEGLRRALPNAATEVYPAADGGEGTIDALASIAGAEIRTVAIEGPGGTLDVARILSAGDLRIVEASEGTGSIDDGDPLGTDSFGLGQTIVEATRSGGEILVAIGGTGSTDGGTGMARALGWRFLDGSGDELPPGGGSLHRLHAILPPEHGPNVTVTGLRDVDSPLLGPRGAARLFGPQKRATAAQVTTLERGLEALAEVLLREHGIDVAEIPGAGAGGGIGAGLVAFLGARLEPGFERIAGLTLMDQAIGTADLVITGEGSFDAGSLGGKVPIGVARIASTAGTRCALVAGRITVSIEELAASGFETAISMEDVAGAEAALAHPDQSLVEATVELIRRGGY